MQFNVRRTIRLWRNLQVLKAQHLSSINGFLGDRCGLGQYCCKTPVKEALSASTCDSISVFHEMSWDWERKGARSTLPMAFLSNFDPESLFVSWEHRMRSD